MKLNNLAIAAAVLTAATAFSPAAQAQTRVGGGADGGDAPAGCSAGSCDHGGKGGSSANSNSNSSNKVNVTAVFAPSVGAAVDECTAVTGASLGVGISGFGISGGANSVDNEHYKACTQQKQLVEVLRQDNCNLKQIAIAAMANGAESEGMFGNPALLNVTNSPKGAQLLNTACGKAPVAAAPRPNGG